MGKLRRQMIIWGVGALLMLMLPPPRADAQTLGVKTNALAWAMYGTFNAGVEVGFARRWSVEVDGIYNPYTWSDRKKTHIWAVQGEVRHWFRHKFTGHFIGLHGHYGEYDWGVKKYRYKGDLYGGGVSYGYTYMIGKRWSVEGNIGLGFTRLERDHKYDRRNERLTYPVGAKNYWGPTRAGIRITYLIK